MPIYKVQAPDGKIYKVEGPEGATEDQLFGFVSSQIGFQPAEVKPQEGIGAALAGGFKRFLSTGETALESIIDPELAARRGVERAEQIGQQYAPGASLEKVKQAYAERGLFPAIGEAVSQIPSALAEQAPQIAATLGSAKLGAMAGAPFGGPVGALIGGVGGAALPSLVQLYGSNIERQAQENAPEISRTAALGAAAPGAALEVASTFIPLGRNLIGKLLGPTAEKALARGSNEAIERAANESVTASLLKGTGVGALAEIPTEVAQQMLERFQAGLPLTTEDALKEYGEAAYGAGLVGGPFGAAARTLGRPAARSEFEKLQEQEQAKLAVSEEELAEKFPEGLPGGFKINREEVGRETTPQGFSIMAEGREEPLSVVDTKEEADAKLESLSKIRAEERENLLKEEEKINAEVQKAKDRLERLEATEQTSTDEYKSLKAELPTMMDESAQKIKDLYNRAESLSKPLTAVPFGETERIKEQFTVVGPDAKPVGTFNTMGEAEAVVKQSVGEDVFEKTQKSREVAKELYKTFVPQMRKFGLGDVGLNIVDKIENGAGGAYLDKLIRVSLEEANPVQVMRHESLHAMKDLGFFTPQQWKALEERANKQWIKEFLEGQETEVDGQKMSRLEGYRKLGYSEQDIIEEAIADAFGAYDKGAKPPPGMIAALFRKIKDFFSSLGQALRGAGFQSADDIFQQIERGRLKPAAVKPAAEAKPAAKEKLSLAPEGIPQKIWSLHEKVQLADDEATGRIAITTEKGKAPGALKRNQTMTFRRLNKEVMDFVGNDQQKALDLMSKMSAISGIRDAIKNEDDRALETYKVANPELYAQEVGKGKFSLPIMRGEETPKFEGPPKEGETEPTKLKPTVDLVGQYFDKQIKDRNGSKLDYTDKQSFDNAVKTATDEVKYQMEKEKSGLDWYEDDVKEAFKQTKKFIPELGKTDNRLLFSVIAGIMSPQTNARDNWFIAAKAFEHYIETKTIPGNNPETGGLWQGGTQSPNKKIQLEFLDRMVKDMGQKKALEWLFQDHPVKEINEFRQKYGNIKSGIEGKLTDMKPGLYAFGPKVGPFVSNLNGIHDVTVDKWMTRTFNRYFGTMTGADGKIIDAPTEPQRRAVKALVNEVAKNAGIKPYQVQSLLWFYEQRLFTEIGVPSPSYGFSDGGRKYAESRGRGGEEGVSPAAETIARPVKGEKREATRPAKPVEGPGPRSGEKLKRGEKYSLRSDLRSYLGSNQTAPKPYKRKSLGDGEGVRVLGVQPVAQYEPIDSFKTLVGQYGFQSPAFYELDGKNANVYQQAIQKSKDASPYGAAVYVYPVEEYADMRLFLTGDGKAGFALKGDDIVSVFSGPPHKGSANSSLQLAVQEGGRRLDAFDTVLPELYNVNGFQVVGRLKWNEDYKPDGWDKKTFFPFNNGEPDVVYMVYKPSDNRTVSENPGEYFDDPDELARVQKDAARTTKGIVLGTKQPGAISIKGAHYGNVKVDELDATKYGTGLRGAERRRLEQAFDDRIKKRVNFYVKKEDGSTPIPESGVGNHVYTQQFDNILGPGAEMSRLFREARGDSNDFESNVIDAGYDGYAVPSMGMMVILNHNVPVNYIGPRAEVGVQKLSLKNIRFLTAKEAKEAVKAAGTPDTNEFKQYNAGNQWVDADGKPKVFYHATARNFFEFTPAGQSQAIFLAETPEEAEGFGSIAEDKLRREVYRALSKDEKLNLFKGVVDSAVEKKTITEKQGQDFMRQANRKVPDYGDFGDIEQNVYDALMDLSPTRMSIMPLYARAMSPFDFENKEHVDQVMNWVANNTQYPQDFPEKWLNGMKGRISQGLWQAIEDKRVQQAIRALGFDAFTVRENRASPKNYAVYQPQQVKSVTGNDGSFSLETKDIRYSLKSVRYTPERFQALWEESMYIQSGAEKKTKGYLAFVDPMDFVKATATPETLDRLRKEQEPLDIERLSKQSQHPYLSIDIRNGEWKITGHEGRHRMLALHDAGYRQIPIYIYMRADDAEPIAHKFINAQYDDSVSSFLMVTNIEPLSYANKNRAMEKFTRMDSKVKYSLPNLSKATRDRMNDVAPQRYKPNWKDRVIGAFKQDYTQLRQTFINRYETLSVYDRAYREKVRKAGGPEVLADQSAEFAALQSDLSAGVAAAAMGIGDRQGGVPVYRNGVTTIDTSVKGLTEALAPLAKYGDPEIYQRYQFWAGWKRGRRLLREGREELYNAADAQKAQEIERNHPEFVQVQKDLIAFNNGIVNYAVQTGVLSKERAQVYTKYADYIPFYRQLELDQTIGPNPFSGISGQKGPKKLKGSQEVLGDFMENMVRNTQSMINAGMKNAAAQMATKVALEINQVERMPGPIKGLGVDAYTVLENGQLVYYRANDKLFVDSLSSLHMPDLPFMGLLSAPANLLRSLVTKDPGFMLANLLRDSLSSYVTSGQKITPVVGTMANFGKALSGKNKTLQALFNAGVIGGYEFSQNIEQSGESLTADLNKKAGKDPILLRPFKSLWDGLEKGTTASDAATRMAVYERVMQETGNEAEAISRALEVMNFNRKGNSVLIRIATAALPFFNARLQGLDLFWRASTGRMNTTDAQEIKRRFWIRGVTMMSLSVMYYLSVADDEEYEKQEEETKDNNWIFPSLGIRVPIPFEVGTLFKTMPERITAYLMGNDTGKELGESTLRALANTFAFNPIPQTFKPLIEAATNFNFFTMRPIVGQGMQDVAPQFQVGPGTSKTAEFIGGKLNLSPLKVDQILKGYTGTIGGYAVDVVDAIASEFSDAPKAAKRFEQMPVVKRFALDPEARGNVTQFYELQKAVDTFVRTSNLLEKTARPEEFAKYLEDNVGLLAVKDYVSNVEKEMKTLRDMKRTIASSDMSPEEKRDLTVEIGRMENHLTANIGQVKKVVNELK